MSFQDGFNWALNRAECCNCGKGFKPTTFHNIFCSPACRSLYASFERKKRRELADGIKKLQEELNKAQEEFAQITSRRLKED